MLILSTIHVSSGQIVSKLAERLRRCRVWRFSKGGRPPSWIYGNFRLLQQQQERVMNTSIHHNVSELRQMKLNANFTDECYNLTTHQRTELTVQWGDYTELYILTIDDIRENFIIPSILQVSSLRHHIVISAAETDGTVME